MAEVTAAGETVRIRSCNGLISFGKGQWKKLIGEGGEMDIQIRKIAMKEVDKYLAFFTVDVWTMIFTWVNMLILFTVVFKIKNISATRAKTKTIAIKNNCAKFNFTSCLAIVL